MKNQPERHFPLPAYRPGDAPPSRPTRRNVLLGTVTCAMATFLLLIGVAAADDNDNPVWLREFIGHEVGGLTNLKVPARNYHNHKPATDCARASQEAARIGAVTPSSLACKDAHRAP